MKALVLIFAILYFVSPIDIAPGIPIDDIIALIAGVSYMLKPAD